MSKFWPPSLVASAGGRLEGVDSIDVLCMSFRTVFVSQTDVFSLASRYGGGSGVFGEARICDRGQAAASTMWAIKNVAEQMRLEDSHRKCCVVFSYTQRGNLRVESRLYEPKA